jgi:hypothetical protein
MDIRTISATLAILGTGLSLSACKKGADATEVPASTPAAADGSCGADKGHGHASCSADKTAGDAAGDDKAEKSCGAKGDGSCGAKGDGSCGAKGDGSCGGDKAAPPSTAAAEPTPTPTTSAPAVAADTTAPAATSKTKTKTAKKKKANGEAACGEGTCA